MTAPSAVPVLIVGDNPGERAALAAVVAPLGCTVVEADSGAAALRCVLAQDFAVILLDVHVPIMDGFATAALIHQRRPSEMTPIIFITASAGDEIDDADPYAEGAVDVMFAPVRPDALRAKVAVFAHLFLKAAALEVRAREMEATNRELTAIARRDTLTGLGNRRALQEDLDTLEARVSRYGHRYCLALLDVDYYKSYNDSYGHQAGDRALQVVAGELLARPRGGDTFYRYGGDEFVCIFPEQSLTNGALAVRRLQLAVHRRAIPHAQSPFSVLTFSAGVAVMEPTDPRPVSAVFHAADEALYRAKQLGRNRVEHRGPPCPDDRPAAGAPAPPTAEVAIGSVPA